MSSRSSEDPSSGELRRMQGQINDLRDRLIRLEGLRATLDPPPEPALRAQAIRDDRRRRDAAFGAELFREAGFDMLLELYVAEQTGRQVLLSRLAEVCDVPNTTGLRWIQRLEREGWIQRVPNPLHRRRVFAVLTERASEAMRTYLDGVPLATETS